MITLHVEKLEKKFGTEQVFRDNDPDDNRQILAPPV